MDLLGSATYLFPGIGEWYDLIWAPISAYIFMRSFGGKIGHYGGLINFAEEFLPFTDFIPTYTLGFLYNHFIKKR